MCHGCSCIQWMPCVDILGYMGNECLHKLFGYAVVSHSRVCVFNQQFQERKGYVNSPNWWVMPEAHSSTNCPCSCEYQAAHTLRPRSRTCSHTLITIDCKCHTYWTMSCETNDWFECVSQVQFWPPAFMWLKHSFFSGQPHPMHLSFSGKQDGLCNCGIVPSWLKTIVVLTFQLFSLCMLVHAILVYSLAAGMCVGGFRPNKNSTRQ